MRRGTKRGTIKHARPIAMPEIDRKAMGLRIQAARLLKGWTQESLARAIGVKTPTVKMWEGGHQLPDLYNLVRLSIGIRRTMDYLLLGVHDRFKRKR